MIISTRAATASTLLLCVVAMGGHGVCPSELSSRPRRSYANCYQYGTRGKKNLAYTSCNRRNAMA
eukprot:2153687-Pleurochrysis_carterae.AAC.1